VATGNGLAVTAKAGAKGSRLALAIALPTVALAIAGGAFFALRTPPVSAERISLPAPHAASDAAAPIVTRAESAAPVSAPAPTPQVNEPARAAPVESSTRPEPVTRAAKSGPPKSVAANAKSKGAEGKPAAAAPAAPAQDLLDDRQ